MDDQKLRELMESVDCCFWQLNTTGVFTYCSPQIMSLLGYEPHEVIGRHIYDFVSGGDHANQIKALHLLLTEHKPVNHVEVVFQHRNRGDTCLDLWLAPCRSTHGDEPGYHGMVQRVARPMVPEHEYISGTEALEKILEAVLIIGADLKIVYANRNFYELFGYEPEDVLGAPLGTLGVDRRETISSSEEVIAAIHARGFWQGEVRRRAKPGNYIPVLLNARPFTDSHGSFKGYIGTYQDLRETHSAGMKNWRALLSVVQAITCAIEHRTPDQLSHQKRVAELCVDIGLELGLDHKRLEGLRLGALLHDIGKLYLPAEILARRGPLNEFEAGLINSHPRLGSDVVKGLELPWPLEDMILQHHEKLDGSGYPNHLKGDEIIQEARTIAVVDALDELHHHAASADGRRAGPSLGQLEEKMGEWYDSEIVEVCMRLLKTGRYPDYTRLISPG